MGEAALLNIRRSAARRRRHLPLLILSLVAVLPAPVGVADAKAHTRGKVAQFGLIGDTAYVPGSEHLLDDLISDLDAERLTAVGHIGDFQAVQGCTEETFTRTLAQFDRSASPFVYTPGDNDWVDCWGPPIGAPHRDPLPALDDLRRLFFPTAPGGRAVSLGQRRIALIRQSTGGDDPATPSVNEAKFIENQMWVDSGVLFAAFHATGSSDNCLQRAVGGAVVDGDLSNVPASCSAEKRERQAANISWIEKAFATARAKRVKGVALLTQPNMDWNVTLADGSCTPPGSVLPDGVTMTAARYNTCRVFEEYQVTIGSEAKSFRKPVALLWGDAHFFRYFKPIPDAPNLVGVQTTGSPNFGWVRVKIDHKDPQLFSFSVGDRCVAGPLNERTSTRNGCMDTNGVRVLAPSTNAGTFEGFELGLSDPTNASALSSVPIDSLPGGRLEGEVVYAGRGCPDPDGPGGPAAADPYLADTSGKIALIDRGGCTDDNKVAWAQHHGATAAFLVNATDAHLFTIFTAGNSPVLTGSPDVVGTRITIPALGVYRTVGHNRLRAADGGPVRVRVEGTQRQLRDLIQLHG